jgi:hypothetical protein
LLLAYEFEWDVELSQQLVISRPRDHQSARRTQLLKPSGNIDAVPHQIAVRLLDDIAKVNANAQRYLALGRYARIAVDHSVLHLDRAAHCIDDAPKLDEAAVPGALDGAPVMRGDRGIDQITAQPSKTRQRAVLIRPGEPTVADHVGHQDRSDLARLAHGELPPLARLA